MNRILTSAMIFYCAAFWGWPSSKSARADDDEVARTNQSTIIRGLNFLQADAVKWRQDKTCSTCHHGSMTMWVQLEALSRGFTVAPDELQENIRWAKERIMERADLPRDTRAGWSMVNTPAIYAAIMAHMIPKQQAFSAADLNRIAGHVLRHQEENGAWMWSSAPPKNVPPPFFESDEVATRLAWLALSPQSRSGSDEARSIQANLDRAEQWLQNTPPTESTQAAVLRLIMLQQKTASEVERKQAVDELLKLQSSDGGWAQLRGGASDAYATGQVLYGLSLAGVPCASEPVRRAITFLVNSQRDDGSWPMKKRTHPGETPTQNVVPITYFGTAWAVLGLMRYAPCEIDATP